ncbi:MAG: tetratricopeptide repeat protein, partial [Planctomycetales bacterium]
MSNECRLRQGLCLFALEKYQDAEKLFGQAVSAKDFAYADLAMLRQGDCLQLRGDHPKAAALFDSLLKKFPESTYKVPAQLAAGKSLYQTEKYTDAQKRLSEVATAKAPQSPEAAYWLGRSLLKLKKPADAVQALDQALAAYSQDPFAGQLTVARLDALFELPDRRGEAIKEYAAFAEKQPQHEFAPHALYMAALGALGQADYPPAKTHSGRFLAEASYAKHALTPEVLFLAAESRVLSPDARTQPNGIAESEALYRRLLAECPQNRHVAMSGLRIGLCLYLQKKHDESIAELTKTVAALKDPELLAEARLLIGRNYSDTNKMDQAIASLQDALKAKNDWKRGDEVLLALAHCLLQTKKLDDARQQLDKLNSSYSDSRYRDQATYQLGEIASLQSKHDEAVKWFREVVQKYPQSPLAA